MGQVKKLLNKLSQIATECTWKNGYNDRPRRNLTQFPVKNQLHKLILD